MIKRWSYPSWCGDFTLEADGEHSVLVVTDPVAGEIEQLAKFISYCAAHGWVAGLPGISPQGETRIMIGAPVHEAAHRLLKQKGKARPGILTAVKSVAGVVTAVKGDGAPLEKELAKPEAADAVTVRRPTPSCPDCLVGPEDRASRVLARFSTRRQREEWERDGVLHCVGERSGHLYRVAHRASPVAAAQGRPAFDETDGVVVHCHDRSVPPAEEALAIKLTLEHAEAWLRNPSGIFVDRARHVFGNPFMTAETQHLDGTADTMLVNGLVGGVFGLALAEVFSG